MKLRYVFLIAVLAFAAGMIAGSLLVGVPLMIQLLEARDELAQSRAVDAAAEAADDGPVHVLIVRRRIPEGSAIREPAEMFDLERSGQDGLAAKAVTLARPSMIETLKGRRLRRTVEPGHMLTEDDLLKEDVDFGGMLEKGKHVVAIPITADRHFGFVAVPGTKVVVVHAVEGKAPAVLLEDVLVLALDVNAAGAIATVQVETEEQVAQLKAAKDKGTLTLVLRPAQEEEKKAPDDKK